MNQFNIDKYQIRSQLIQIDLLQKQPPEAQVTTSFDGPYSKPCGDVDNPGYGADFDGVAISWIAVWTRTALMESAFC